MERREGFGKQGLSEAHLPLEEGLRQVASERSSASLTLTAVSSLQGRPEDRLKEREGSSQSVPAPMGCKPPNRVSTVAEFPSGPLPPISACLARHLSSPSAGSPQASMESFGRHRPHTIPRIANPAPLIIQPLVAGVMSPGKFSAIKIKRDKTCGLQVWGGLCFPLSPHGDLLVLLQTSSLKAENNQVLVSRYFPVWLPCVEMPSKSGTKVKGMLPTSCVTAGRSPYLSWAFCFSCKRTSSLLGFLNQAELLNSMES